MITINTIDDKYFSLDGIQFAKIYQPLAQGSEAIGIYNVFDTSQQLKNSTDFNQYSINGVTYGSQSATVAAILAVVYSIISIAEFEDLESRIENVEANQLSGVLYFNTYALMITADPTGQLNYAYKVIADPDTSLNGDYTSDGTTYTQQTNSVNGIVVSGNVDATSGDTVFNEVDPLNKIVKGEYSTPTSMDGFYLKDITVDGFTSGDLSCTRENGRVYPWFYKEISGYGFTLATTSRYLVICKSSNTAIAITIDSTSNSGIMFRFDEAGNFTPLTSFTNHQIAYGSIIEADMYNNVVNIRVDNVLKWSIDLSIYTDIEFSNPAFGNVLYTDGLVVSDMETIKESLVSNVNEMLPVVESTNGASNYQFEVSTDAGEFGVNGLEINSITNGEVDCTRNSGRSYPWMYTYSKKYGFELNANSRYLVLGITDTTALTITLANNESSGSLYIFDNTDGLTPVDNLDNYQVDIGAIVRAYRFFNIISIYVDNVLFWTIDVLSYSNAEFSSEVFGSVTNADGVIINALNTGGLNDNVSELDRRVLKLEGDASISSYASLGDSIEATGDSQQILVDEFGISTLQNTAVPSTTMVSQGANFAIAQLATITGTPRLITSNFGTNDFGINLTLGANGDTNPTTTFWGALDAYCKALRTDHPAAKIFFYNIQHRDWQNGGQVAGLINENGDSVEDFNNAIETKCREYGIFLVDLYQNWGVSKENINDYTYDRLHPTASGYTRRSRSIISKIKELY